jgi:hypothetical protein
MERGLAGSSSGQAYGQASTAAARESQTAAQSGRLMDSRKRLHEVISMLEQRLSGVLRVTPPSPSDTTKEAITLVPWAEFLRECADDVDTASSRLQEMINRLEI